MLMRRSAIRNHNGTTPSCVKNHGLSMRSFWCEGESGTGIYIRFIPVIGRRDIVTR